MTKITYLSMEHFENVHVAYYHIEDGDQKTPSSKKKIKAPYVTLPNLLKPDSFVLFCEPWSPSTFIAFFYI